MADPPPPPSLGPLGLDYLSWYASAGEYGAGSRSGPAQVLTAQVLQGCVVVAVSLWLAFLVHLLATTSSNYFSPTLASMSLKWRIGSNVAGVTLLAFANGAPDVFSSISGLVRTGSAAISVGELFGGALFISTMVVSAIAIRSPVPISLSPVDFSRDAAFLLIAVTALAYAGLVVHAMTLVTSAGFLAIYLLYIGCVLSTPWWMRKLGAIIPRADAGSRDSNNECSSSSRDSGGGCSIDAAESALPLPLQGRLQTAFWFADAADGPAAAQATLTTPPAEATRAPPPAPAGGYKFLILDDPDVEGDAENGKGGHVGSDDGEINLSGLSAVFSGALIEDYVNVPRRAGSSAAEDAPRRMPSLVPSLLAASTRAPATPPLSARFEMSTQWALENSNSPLAEALLRENDDGPSSAADADTDADGVQATAGVAATGAQQRGRFLRYLLQLMLRRRHHTAGDYGRIPAPRGPCWLPRRVVSVLEYPFSVARDVTVPTVDPELWYKPYAIMQPLIAPFFLLGMSGHLHIPSFYSASATTSTTASATASASGPSSAAEVALLVAGAAGALWVALFTHTSKPPPVSDPVVTCSIGADGNYDGGNSGGSHRHHRHFVTTWLVLAFAVCIAWIYLFAAEIVCCLTAVGAMVHLPPSFLGLTVLAWGNSASDLFANLAVAKRGLGEMAVAGCYGGPVFNVLVGIGASFGCICLRRYPTPFDLALDTSAIVSVAFLYVSLLSTLVLVAGPCQFRLRPELGYYLVSLYLVYTAVQVGVLCL